MQPRFLHSAGFRRWAGPLIADEMHLIERLERQRHATGRVRAYVADPQRRFTRILCLYLTWLQTHVRPTHSAIIGLRTLRNAPRMNLTRLRRFRDPQLTPKTARVKFFRYYQPPVISHLSSFLSPLSLLPRALFFSGRNTYATHGLAYDQILILDADLISPSRPYWNSSLDKLVPSTAFGLPCCSDSVCIIVGDPYRRRRNPFRRQWLQWQTRPASPWLLVDPVADPIPKPPPPLPPLPAPHSDTSHPTLCHSVTPPLCHSATSHFDTSHFDTSHFTPHSPKRQPSPRPKAKPMARVHLHRGKNNALFLFVFGERQCLPKS